MVILFLYLDTGDKKYPILFDYWISEIYYEEDEVYLNKYDIFIKSLEYVINNGLKFDKLIFDSGFFNSNVINYLESKDINYVSRTAKNKKFLISGSKQRADKIFSETYNGEFYYYHKTKSFLNQRIATIWGNQTKLVAIAKNAINLKNKKLIFLISNQLELTHTEIQRLYKSRWNIESFFKLLKSYLSLSTFYRNNYEYVEQKINLALSAFIVVQELSHKLKKKFVQTLRIIQNKDIDDLVYQCIHESSKYFKSYVSENETSENYAIS